MHRQTPIAEVRKILFVEKRRERLHIGECRRTRKPVIPVGGRGWWGVGFIAFLHCLMAKMPFRCKGAFPREEKCLLDLLRSVLQVPLSVTTLNAVRDRDNKVCSVTASC
jgi:hypothetical protein